jgi:hypothetical protein
MDYVNRILTTLKNPSSFLKQRNQWLTKENVLNIIFILLIVMIVFSDSFIISLFIHSTILRLIWLGTVVWMIFYKKLITGGLLLLLLFVVALNTHSYIRVNKKAMEHFKDVGADPDDSVLADIESGDMTPPDRTDNETLSEIDYIPDYIDNQDNQNMSSKEYNSYTEDDIKEMTKEENKRKKEKKLKQKRRQKYAQSSYETIANNQRINAMKKEDFENDRYLPPSVKSKKIDDKFRILHENFHRLEDTINNMERKN